MVWDFQIFTLVCRVKSQGVYVLCKLGSHSGKWVWIKKLEWPLSGIKGCQNREENAEKALCAAYHEKLYWWAHEGVLIDLFSPQCMSPFLSQQGRLYRCNIKPRGRHLSQTYSEPWHTQHLMIHRLVLKGKPASLQIGLYLHSFGHRSIGKNMGTRWHR